MKRIFAMILSILILFSVISADASGFTIKPIDWDTATVGRYALPDGYKAVRVIDNCGEKTTLGHPIRVSVTLTNKNDDVWMMYYYGEDYLERVSSSNSLLRHVEGEIDGQTMTIMHRYKTADQYCDELARKWVNEPIYWKNIDMSACNQRLETLRKQIWNEIAPGLAAYGLNVEQVETTAAQKVYNFARNGKEYVICVLTEVYGYRYSANLPINSFTNISWEVPCYYIFTCPYDIFDKVHDDAFAAFVENTSVNDEMMKLNSKLTEKIAADVINQMNMMCAASSAYMESMTELTFSMVESSMANSYTGNYSSDRFSDYLFDQNDYTLSDGSSVKIPTSYDYVWEGSNGTVYYGNSQSDAPTGATQLYANR